MSAPVSIRFYVRPFGSSSVVCDRCIDYSGRFTRSVWSELVSHLYLLLSSYDDLASASAEIFLSGKQASTVSLTRSRFSPQFANLRYSRSGDCVRSLRFFVLYNTLLGHCEYFKKGWYEQ